MLRNFSATTGTFQSKPITACPGCQRVKVAAGADFFKAATPAWGLLSAGGSEARRGAGGKGGDERAQGKKAEWDLTD
jgi:hypothetical protein